MASDALIIQGNNMNNSMNNMEMGSCTVQVIDNQENYHLCF